MAAPAIRVGGVIATPRATTTKAIFFEHCVLLTTYDVSYQSDSREKCQYGPILDEIDLFSPTVRYYIRA